MRKLIVLVSSVSVALLLCPSFGAASYLIRLNNGGQFVVSQYWEEDAQLKFYSHGGVVEIPKRSVAKISETNVAYGAGTDSGFEATVEDKVKQEPTIAPSGKGQIPSQDDALRKKTRSTRKNKDEVIDFEYYQKKKWLLKAKVDEALERFREASSNKESQAKREAIQDMTRISDQIFDLADELKQKNGGVLPYWWEDL